MIVLILSAGAVTLIEHHFYEILIGFGTAGKGSGALMVVVSRDSSFGLLSLKCF